jgi:hypothetical protein
MPTYPGSSLDLDRYRARADDFVATIGREHYMHFSGQKEGYEIEAIYERFGDLFSREAVDELRSTGSRELLRFAVEGLIGQETKAEEAEVARREARLQIELDGETIPLRQSAVVQANEDDPDRRAALERARLDVVTAELNPLHVQVHERGSAIARELGWDSILSLCEDLSGIDLAALERQTEAFLADTEASYESVVEPELRRHLGLGFDTLRRSDFPALFRAPNLDAAFHADKLIPSLRNTLSGLGIDLGTQRNVVVDAESRPTKDPRAFCNPVLVPEEIYLVISPQGGRDDYESLLHEAGHTEHFAHVTPGLVFERRHLGDNAVTEAYAMLIQYLTSEPAWLEDMLSADAAPIIGYSNAIKLVYLRRYASKLAYERRLHAEGARLEDMPGEYAGRLSRALHVDGPSETWISDVDAFFYAACYLRAWAVERSLSAHLHERFGERWYAEAEAGALLRDIWSRGQFVLAEELLDEIGAPPAIDFGVLVPA